MNNKNFVMVAWLNPKQLTIAVAKAVGYTPPPAVVVFLDRKQKESKIHEVPV